MVEMYKEQKPIKHLLFHSGVGEEPFFTLKPKNYLLWIGRIDYDKSPHYAILAAKKLGIPLYLLGKSVYQREYEVSYSTFLNDSIVKRCGVVFGKKKMKIISEALCGIYSLSPKFIEAGAGVLGEIIASGVPLAGMTWRGPMLSVLRLIIKK